MVKRSFGPRRAVSLEIWPQVATSLTLRRVFHFLEFLFQSPRDQTLRWQQTEEETGDASHHSSRDMPAARPQC